MTSQQETIFNSLSPSPPLFLLFPFLSWGGGVFIYIWMRFLTPSPPSSRIVFSLHRLIPSPPAQTPPSSISAGQPICMGPGDTGINLIMLRISCINVLLPFHHGSQWHRHQLGKYLIHARYQTHMYEVRPQKPLPHARTSSPLGASSAVYSVLHFNPWGGLWTFWEKKMVRANRFDSRSKVKLCQSVCALCATSVDSSDVRHKRLGTAMK